MKLEWDRNLNFEKNYAEQFPQAVDKFCTKIDSYVNSWCIFEKEIIELDVQIFSNQQFIDKFTKNLQFDEVNWGMVKISSLKTKNYLKFFQKSIQGLQDLYELVHFSKNDAWVQNWVGPIFQFLRDDVNDEKNMWPGISSTLNVILFKEMSEMIKLVKRVEGKFWRFKFIALDNMYTPARTPVPIQLQPVSIFYIEFKVILILF